MLSDKWAMLRGSLIGFLVGVLPGAGATVAAFLSYSAEKKLSKNPENFGKGESKGLSAPESASTAAVGGALIPTLKLRCSWFINNCNPIRWINDGRFTAWSINVSGIR